MGGCGCLASANVLEDRGDDIGIFDAGDDAQFAAALGACLDVDGEDAFQALHPGHGGKGLIRLFVARFAFWRDGPRPIQKSRVVSTGIGTVGIERSGSLPGEGCRRRRGMPWMVQ